ncbi:MAG: hypothetical protein JOY70_03075 [Acidisphaera sp.]|nr:hypothetical protein [Acidisphaera sp.]MBV9812710.1 hypothetical protein [Acetobacteraceae bacterium]
MPHSSVRASQRLNRAAGTLAASVLLDSALEHYRGAFKNKAMFTPLVVSTLTLAVSAHGVADHRQTAHRIRQGVYGAGAITGLLGSAFHVYNVLKRPGGLVWQNLFHGAPLGAPMAILLSGLLGSAAEEVRDSAPGRAHVLGFSAGRLLAVVSGIGLLGTTGEAGLLHFRGAFQNPAMYVPVTLPPAGGALLLTAAAGPRRRNRWFTRWWLRVVQFVGLAGVGFHIWGVQRRMGGWRNWTQNVQSGPPIPAPPSFTGLAVAGLAALGLLEDEPHG